LARGRILVKQRSISFFSLFIISLPLFALVHLKEKENTEKKKRR